MKFATLALLGASLVLNSSMVEASYRSYGFCIHEDFDDNGFRGISLLKDKRSGDVMVKSRWVDAPSAPDGYTPGIRLSADCNTDEGNLIGELSDFEVVSVKTYGNTTVATSKSFVEDDSVDDLEGFYLVFNVNDGSDFIDVGCCLISQWGFGGRDLATADDAEDLFQQN